jgi:hypothetical protein
MTSTRLKVYQSRVAERRVVVAPGFDQRRATVGASHSVIGRYPVVHERRQNVESLAVDKSLGSCKSLWGKG